MRLHGLFLLLRINVEYISIKNWGKYQHYHDRNPPWIKLYHSLLDDYEYCCLPDASKLHLVSLFLLASRTENKIPADIDWIKSKAGLKGKIDLEPLVTAGFITTNHNSNQDASKMLADDKQNGVPETEKRQRRDREEKNLYLEYVFLTEKEHQRLLTDFGKDQVDEMIEILDNYIGAIPKKRNKYTDHNRVLRTWVLENYQEKHGKTGGKRLGKILV